MFCKLIFIIKKEEHKVLWVYIRNTTSSQRLQGHVSVKSEAHTRI